MFYVQFIFYSFVLLILLASVLIVFYFVIKGIIGAPWVRTSKKVAIKMFELAELSNGQTVVDFGSGSGSLLFCASSFGAKGIGIEARWLLVVLSKLKKKIRNENRLNFICGDMFKIKPPYADVVAVYLLDTVNKKLEPLLIKNYSSGTRVVSRVFQFKNLTFIKKEVICGDTIYLYQIP